MDQSDIRPLAADETRLIQQIYRPDGIRNDVWVRHRQPGDDDSNDAYVVQIIGTEEVPPQSTTGEILPYARIDDSKSTLEGVYREFAGRLVRMPPPAGFKVWSAPELEWIRRQIELDKDKELRSDGFGRSLEPEDLEDEKRAAAEAVKRAAQ